jgi:hypothetical protein
LSSFGGKLRSLATLPSTDCVQSNTLLYGSGCIRLLPPENWFGYPSCRAAQILPAFGYFMRQHYFAVNEPKYLEFVDNLDTQDKQSGKVSGLRVAFAVRDVGPTTGTRHISNLAQVQMLLRRTQHVTSRMENVTFEQLDVGSTIRYMAAVHIFISVHGAGMTNMFFMNPGSAVVEIIPYPLCSCRSPDYFYGVGGYYHGSAVAQGIKHYHYCVPLHEVYWHQGKISNDILKSNGVSVGSNTGSTSSGNSGSTGKCSWRHLHAVESVYVDPS